MSMRKKYFSLQLKRNIKLYPTILIVTVITMCVLALGVYLIVSETIGTEDNQKIRVGVVGNLEDTTLGVGIEAIKNIDSSRFTIEIREMSRKEAEKALLNGEIHGFMDIPDGFIEGVMRGDNYPATYVVKKGAMNFGSIITGEIADAVSDWVIKSQSSIYSMHSLARDHGITKGMGAKNRQLNMEYIGLVLSRDEIYNIETIGVADDLGIGAYYLCALIVLMLMFWGISCFSIFASKDMPLSKLLASRGIRPMHQVFCEFLSFGAITMITVSIFAAVFSIVLSNVNIVGIEEIGTPGVFDVIVFVLKMLIPVMMICSMHVFVYEAVPNSVGAVLLQFLISVGLGYLCGCFYPNYFFPESIQNMASYLPTGLGFSYLRKCLSDSDTTKELIIMCAYCIAFVTGSGFLRKYKVTGDSQ